MKRIAGGLAALVLLAACGSNDAPAGSSTATEPAAQTFTMTGVLDLVGGSDHFSNSADGCSGVGGYDDLARGTQVVVYGADGKILGAGEVDPGKMQAGGVICRFPWEIAGIPKGAGPYQYEVSHRGRMTVTEVEARGGVSASLG